ncbi:hypothetical protein [Rhizobium ruizarguesonis]|nr:hypothetical protein [Rhizobium ruizarguesonis]
MNAPEITDQQWRRLAEEFGVELLLERPELIPVLLRYLEHDK